MLDLNLLLQSSVMYSMDLSRTGKNEEAYNLISAVLSSAYQMVDSLSLKPYADMAAQYKSLTGYSPYQISVTGDRGIIPFDTIPVGKPDSRQYLMQITDARINGCPAKITFDTGAESMSLQILWPGPMGLCFSMPMLPPPALHHQPADTPSPKNWF